MMTSSEKQTVSSLETHLGYWLRCVSNQVSHAFQLRLAGRGVTVAEWVALREMFDHDGIAPSKLADRLGMTRGAISKLADRLEAKALVTRSADGGDRRAQSLALTPVGRALVPDLSALADENDAQFFGGLDPGDKIKLRKIMKDIVRSHRIRTAPID